MKAITLIITFILFFSIPHAIPYQPNEISTTNGNILYVGGHGAGNYTNIQDAIDNASDGDMVYIYNGTYMEHILIDKNITIWGENRNVTIDGYDNGTVITIKSPCTIVNITVKNSGDEWLDAAIAANSYAIIKNCNISYSSVGVLVSSNADVILSSCNLNTNYYGILSDGRITADNIFIENAGIGIYLHHCNGNIKNTEVFNSGTGILAEVSNASIYNCHLHDLTEGINMHGSCFVHVEECNIHGNEIGISSLDTVGWTLLPEPNGVIIEKSHIWGNMIGIKIYSSHNVSIVDSNISHNGWGVKMVSYSYGNTILNSKIESNMIGIQASVAWSTRINYNTIENNMIGIQGFLCIINARHNYWGSSTGPGGRGIGNGDKLIWIFGRVFYFPWNAS